ncbi:hypothetical protein GCM10011488_26290 [Steroidobacter agaridevorans]|nr:hypothetical protein GCM10011488_26290 [Steroidobacter agaridevorans]
MNAARARTEIAIEYRIEILLLLGARMGGDFQILRLAPAGINASMSDRRNTYISYTHPRW